ncbi:MAG: hypothetical protein J6W75_13730 [Bacteroidaceae bacterium]|nr:hypothetical protein [Bacteroidaceae bacterium]
MKKTLILLAAALTWVACGSDPVEEEVTINESSFYGEWVTFNMEGDYATDIVLKNTRQLTTTTYTGISTNAVVNNEDVGPWVYYPDNKVLRITPTHELAIDYSVVEMSANMMKLRNRDLNLTETYYRIVETQDVDAGQRISIQWLAQHTDFEVQSITSSNQYGLSVSGQEIYAGTRAGLVFVTLSSNKETVVVKLNVSSRITKFTAEVLFDIDTIIATHGTPDATEEGEQTSYIAYHQSSFDDGLNIIQYKYDVNTREVTRIDIVYKTPEGFKADENDVKSTYVMFANNIYGLKQKAIENKFIISPNNENNIMTFGNYTYFLKNDHF